MKCEPFDNLESGSIRLISFKLKWSLLNYSNKWIQIELELSRLKWWIRIASVNATVQTAYNLHINRQINNNKIDECIFICTSHTYDEWSMDEQNIEMSKCIIVFRRFFFVKGGITPRKLGLYSFVVANLKLN